MKRKISGTAPALNAASNLQARIHTVLPPNDVWLCTAKAMAYFSVSARTLRRWRNAQLIPCLKLGGTVYYPINFANQVLLDKIKSHHLNNK